MSRRETGSTSATSRTIDHGGAIGRPHVAELITMMPFSSVLLTVFVPTFFLPRFLAGSARTPPIGNSTQSGHTRSLPSRSGIAVSLANQRGSIGGIDAPGNDSWPCERECFRPLPWLRAHPVFRPRAFLSALLLQLRSTRGTVTHPFEASVVGRRKRRSPQPPRRAHSPGPTFLTEQKVLVENMVFSESRE